MRGASRGTTRRAASPGSRESRAPTGTPWPRPPSQVEANPRRIRTKVPITTRSSFGSIGLTRCISHPARIAAVRSSVRAGLWPLRHDGECVAGVRRPVASRVGPLDCNPRTTVAGVVRHELRSAVIACRNRAGRENARTEKAKRSAHRLDSELEEEVVVLIGQRAYGGRKDGRAGRTAD